MVNREAFKIQDSLWFTITNGYVTGNISPVARFRIEKEWSTLYQPPLRGDTKTGKRDSRCNTAAQFVFTSDYVLHYYIILHRLHIKIIHD